MDTETSIFHQYFKPTLDSFFNRFKVSVTELLLGVTVVAVVSFIGLSKYNSNGRSRENVIFEDGIKLINSSLAVESLEMEQKDKKLGVFNPFASGKLSKLNYDGSRYWVTSENTLPGSWVWQSHPRYPQVIYVPKYKIKDGHFQSGQYWHARSVIPKKNPNGETVSISLSDS